MAAPEVNALLKRGKRTVATHFKSECFRKSGNKSLHEFMNYLFDPRNKSIDDVDVLDWCRWLIAGGVTFDEFSKNVRRYDNAVICGLVWTANFVAYRCRTCGISPCMSLCADCFQAGNHEGHDFNMFRSQAGGACDCGDVSVMKKEGFCTRHGPDRQTQNFTPPQDLLVVAEIMMPRIILRLLHHLRDNSSEEMKDTYQLDMQDADQFLTFLHTLSDMGAAMRKVIGQALSSNALYKELTEVTLLPDGSNSYFVDSQKRYNTALNNMTTPKGFDEYETMPGLSQEMKHKTLLDELTFWMVKYEFPQKMVTLLLSLLPDDNYKEAFTRAFIRHYSRMTLVLINGLNRPAISNRVVHISVQLFSNEVLAVKMVEEYNLLYILIVSLTNMLESILTESSLQDTQSNFHMVVDCANIAMKEHCYWPIVSDLINLFSHKAITIKFLSDTRLVTMWLDLLSYLQGMNLNNRELSQHVEFESETYYAAFSAELEMASSPMWSLISHCKLKDSPELTKSMIKTCLNALQDWYDAINCKDSIKPNPYQLTFHLPLHRYLACFMVQGIQIQGLHLKDIPLTEKMLKTLLIHPLQIQVGIAEIYSQMWVRNGLQIKGQAMTYIQCHFCYSMVDADLYLMQICACKLDPDYFVRTVLERFHIDNWLSYSTTPPPMNVKLEGDHETAMVDAVLTYFSTLLGIRTYLGIKEVNLTRLEMSTLLCMADRQHSQLMDLMPEKSGMTGHGKELFEPTLKEVADYKAPNLEASGGLQQGTYKPKGEIWEKDFDPVHVAIRALYKKDLQSSMDRYTDYVKQTGKFKGKASPWPPFRCPREINPEYKDLYKILHCKTMHSFLFTVMHKALMSTSMPDSILYHAVHLMDLSLSLPPPDTSRKIRSFNGLVHDKQYIEWFSGSNILQNAKEIVREVLVPIPLEDKQFSLLSSLEEMFHLAPSSLSISGGPITAAHSGQIPAVNPVPVPTEIEFDNDPFPLVPIHKLPAPTSAKHVSSKFENKGVETDKAQYTNVPINESIISLLFKLHAKLSGKEEQYIPLSRSNRSIGDAPIGDGPYFIGQVLDKLSQQSTSCARNIEELYSVTSPKKDNMKHSERDEERRRKAKERQKKLMEQFANKQKAFMEQNKEADISDDDTKPSSSSESQTGSFTAGIEKEYECVICGHSSPSTEDKTIGLVVLMQATSVLGHRLQTDTPIELPVDGGKFKFHPVTCASMHRKRLKTLFEHFDETSCQMSINIGWEGGVLVQTCGHYLHLDCHSSYVASLRTQQLTQNLAVNKGEYWCPLCRQLANSVIPIIPEESRYTLVKPVTKDKVQMVKDIAEMMVTRPITPRSSAVTKTMGSVMEDLTNTTYSVFKTYTNSHTSESVLLFVCSVARTNLEVECLQRCGNLSKHTSALRKHSFLPLMHVLSMHSKILTTKPYTDVWSHITGIGLTEQSNSVSVYLKDVPLLLRDPTAILIQLILTLPSTIEKEHYQLIVMMLYNVIFIQALVSTSCKFTAEEREAWRKKGRPVPFQTLEGMLSHVITRLEVSRLYDDVDMIDKDIPAICQSVWSPQSVDYAVQDYCLPFLKTASLIRFHLFEEEFPPPKEDATEFQILLSYLGLYNGFDSSSATCLNWLIEEPMTLTRLWCSELVNFINEQPTDSKSLLMYTPTWHPPQLIVLPHHYYKIFQSYNSRQCGMCSSVPKDPALCLVCGQYLCFRQSCCQQQSSYECVHHSVQCGAGTGMFLLINSSTVVVIRGPRATLWGSIYLDDHGEEDRELKRGKPLFLSQERYNLLKQQWLSHSFDHSCKRWIWHLDRL
ncbi:E3 ubiquitin-protein ligase UBR3-like [Mytilus californianus]|nr:E3 ubiquitin-protein ligase UBR3-like [Mytilus californianus]